MPGIAAKGAAAGDDKNSPLGMKGDARSGVVKAMMRNAQPGGKKNAMAEVPKSIRQKLLKKPAQSKKRATRAAKDDKAAEIAVMMDELVPQELRPTAVPGRAVIQTIERQAQAVEAGRRMSSDAKGRRNEDAKYRHNAPGHAHYDPARDVVAGLHHIRQPQHRGFASGMPRDTKEVAKSMKR